MSSVLVVQHRPKLWRASKRVRNTIFEIFVILEAEEGLDKHPASIFGAVRLEIPLEEVKGAL